MKICSGCEIQLPMDSFGGSKRTKDGKQTRCKACNREYFKNYRDTKPDVVARAQAKWQESNPGVAVERARLDRKLDPTRHAGYSKRYRENNPTARQLTTSGYYRRNKDSIRNKYATYAKVNRHKLAAKSALRRSFKRRAIAGWISHDAVAEMYETCKLLSATCGVQFHVDHIVPLTSDIVCGLHWEGNLQVVLAADNLTKGNRFWPDMP